MTEKLKKYNVTIPNFLTLGRILINPFFVEAFFNNKLVLAVIFLLISAFSDAVDGFIARRFNQTTDFGKILDPFADKLTQVSIAIVLSVKFHELFLLLILIVLKELTMMLFSLYLLINNQKPVGARWYGKIATATFYLSVSVIISMFVLEMSGNIFKIVSVLLLIITAIMMLYAGVRYFLVFKEIKNNVNQYSKI